MSFWKQFCLHLPNVFFCSKYKSSSSFTVSKVKGKWAGLLVHDHNTQVTLGFPENIIPLHYQFNVHHAC